MLIWDCYFEFIDEEKLSDGNRSQGDIDQLILIVLLPKYCKLNSISLFLGMYFETMGANCGT